MTHSLSLPLRVALLLCCLASALSAADRPDRVIADFNGDNYGDWTVAGDCFGDRPAQGTLPDQQPVDGFLGHGLINTYLQGDRTTGTLTSPQLRVDRRYLNFLIGGGNHPNQTCMNLLFGDKVVRSATGRNNERLEWCTWDLSDLQGRTVALQIVDQHSEGWGHINIDQITLSDRPQVEQVDPIARAMQSDEQGSHKAETDPTRPSYHVLAPSHWINDPNGPVFYNGYYHLFYQHNPYDDQWGHMHWGHVRSKDLATWEHLPIALAPAEPRGEEHVFSGCTTLRPGMPPIIFYTSVHFGKDPRYFAEQWAAVPKDNQLLKWERVDENPILTLQAHGDLKVWDWRDPFTFEHGGKTYMIIGANLNDRAGGGAVVLIYEPANRQLTQWTYRGVMFKDPNVENIECPNFFPLGDKWVLITSPHGWSQVHVGTFNPQTLKFTSESMRQLSPSDNFYAPNSMTTPDGRRLLWGWVKGFENTKGWNGCLTLPRVLTLGDDGLVRQTPAAELEALRTYPEHRESISLDNETRVIENIESDTMELRLTVKLDGAQAFVLHVRRSADGARSVPIRWDGKTLDVAGAQAPLSASESNTVELRAFLDRGVIEVFSAEGSVALTRTTGAAPDEVTLAVEAVGGRATVQSLDAWRIQSIWKK